MHPSLARWDSPAPTEMSSKDAKTDQPKKPRHRHAPHQLAALNELYERTEHPTLEQRTALAEKLGMYVSDPLCRHCLPGAPLRAARSDGLMLQGNKDGQLVVSE